jgi:hypothetical protein
MNSQRTPLIEKGAAPRQRRKLPKWLEFILELIGAAVSAI